MFAGIGFARLIIVKAILVVEAWIGIDVFELPLIVTVLVVLLEFGGEPIAFEGFTAHFDGEVDGGIVASALVFNEYRAIVWAGVGEYDVEFFAECAINGVCVLVHKFCFELRETGVAYAL